VKTAVTGGAGFIGSHLCEALLAQGLEVTALDNLETGREENLAQCLGRPGFSLVKADVLDPAALESALAGAEWVLHIAGLADVIPSIQHPAKYFAANAQGTLNVLQAARGAGVKRFIYAASSSCYGIPDILPTGEKSPMRPMSPYALSKLMGEQMALHWWKVYGLPCVSLRLFNVFGPRARARGAYASVFGVFLAQKVHGKPFTVVGDGNQTRDFIYVTDVADAFIAAARSAVCGEAINIGSGAQMSVNLLAGLLGGPVVHLPKRPGEPDRSWADVSRAKKLLGWSPKVPFEDGVAMMLARLEDWRAAQAMDAEDVALATARLSGLMQ
jgi:UDP-glucose 4-epimerase